MGSFLLEMEASGAGACDGCAVFDNARQAGKQGDLRREMTRMGRERHRGVNMIAEQDVGEV